MKWNSMERSKFKVKFRWAGDKKWKTLKHLGKPFTDMNESIIFVRHNKTEWGLQLKLKLGICGTTSQWDNF